MKKIALSLFILFWSGIAAAQLSGGLMFPGPGTPASSGGGVSGWCGAIPQSGLTNCWPMDSTYTTSGTATDPIGGKNMTLTSVTLNGSGPTGSTNLNNAVVMNGTTSHGDATGTCGPSGSTWSLVYWVDVTTAGNSNTIIANDHTDSNNGGMEVKEWFSNDLLAYVGNGTTNSSVTTSGAFTVGTWLMVTEVYASNTLTVYFGAGTSEGTTTLTGPINACSSHLGIGYNPQYSGDFATIKMAGIAYYSGVALTTGQISTINGL